MEFMSWKKSCQLVISYSKWSGWLVSSTIEVRGCLYLSFWKLNNVFWVDLLTSWIKLLRFLGRLNLQVFNVFMKIIWALPFPRNVGNGRFPLQSFFCGSWVMPWKGIVSKDAQKDFHCNLAKRYHEFLFIKTEWIRNP